MNMIKSGNKTVKENTIGLLGAPESAETVGFSLVEAIVGGAVHVTLSLRCCKVMCCIMYIDLNTNNSLYCHLKLHQGTPQDW